MVTGVFTIDIQIMDRFAMRIMLCLLVVVTISSGCKEQVTEAPSGQVQNSTGNQSASDNKAIDSSTRSNEFPSLDWISIDTDGWRLLVDKKKLKIWEDNDGDTLALTLFSAPEVDNNGLPQDFPDLTQGSEKLRVFLRKVALEHERWIVNVSVKDLGNDVLCSYSITKGRQSSGLEFEFIGCCSIPRRDFSFMIFVTCSDTGMTGIREAVVAKELMENGTVSLIMPTAQKPGKMVGFHKDPYDSAFDEDALYNLSDQEEYDDQFPNSPISRTRSKFNRVVESLQFSQQVIDAAAYTGGQSAQPEERDSR